MKHISDNVSINAGYTRSVNLDRDANSSELLDSYILTTCSTQCLHRAIDAVTQKKNSGKAWSLIGPYGSGKSSFALFLSQLLANPKGKVAKKALQKLEQSNETKGKKLKKHLAGSAGYCKLLLSGNPEPLASAFLKAMKHGITEYFSEISKPCKAEIQAINRLLKQKDISTAEITGLIDKLQAKIKRAKGKGLLIVIDELGKFLEYEARHDRDDVFLLQVLAERAYKTSDVNLMLFVMLHQSFEQYCKNLGERERNEWLKIQGRFETIPFVETTEQILHIMSKAFEKNLAKQKIASIKKDIKNITARLHKAHALPSSLSKTQAEYLFLKCYPLHPITLLMLPILCQKVAQNERTLFSYIGSQETYGLLDSMSKTEIGQFIYPHAVYDYFIANQHLYTNDIQTQRRWVEAITAIERLTDAADDEVNLLKAVGLFNIVGSHGGLKATAEILSECLPNKRASAGALKKLLSKSAVTYRKFNNEYRVWQGSDFDLEKTLQDELSQSTVMDVAEAINRSHALMPIVARRYSIEKHSMFYFEPVFINTEQYKQHDKKGRVPRIIFCLTESKAEAALFKSCVIKHFSNQDLCVLCGNTEQINQAVRTRAALDNVGKLQEINQDPVIQREFRDYHSAVLEQEQEQISRLFENPLQHKWYNDGAHKKIRSKREIQKVMSGILESIYTKTPVIKNELINRDKSSGQANLGRRKLLLALLENSTKADLGIDKYPAEKSMYRALIQASGIHKNVNKQWQISKPKRNELNFAPAWEKIEKFLNSAEEQSLSFSKLDAVLTAPPYGIKKAMLPILYLSVYLYKQDEVEVYEERFYVPYFTSDHLERFLKRPNDFAFRIFRIEGIKQKLVSEYERGLFEGKRSKNALALFKPMAKFITNIPEYTKQTKTISSVSRKVRDSFKYAQSPQKLLFEVLPEACGYNTKKTKGFGEKLKGALREIKNAYPEMLTKQTDALKQIFGLKHADELQKLRARATEYCEPLKQYTLDKKLVEFIKNTTIDFGNDENWLERLLSFMIGKPTKHWTDDEADYVRNKIMEYGRALNELDKLKAYSHGHKLNQNKGQTYLVSIRDMAGRSKGEVVFLENGWTDEERIKFIQKHFDDLAESFVIKKEQAPLLTKIRKKSV